MNIPFELELDACVAAVDLVDRGASQIVHFSVAESGFLSIHVSHVQSADAEVVVDDDDEAGAGAEGFVVFATGRGDSQIVHFSLAESGFLSIHISQVQSAAGADDDDDAVALDFDELAAVRSKV